MISSEKKIYIFLHNIYICIYLPYMVNNVIILAMKYSKMSLYLQDAVQMICTCVCEANACAYACV